jgi:hypothetical protein
VKNRFQNLPFKCNLQRYIPGFTFPVQEYFLEDFLEAAWGAIAVSSQSGGGGGGFGGGGAGGFRPQRGGGGGRGGGARFGGGGGKGRHFSPRYFAVKTPIHGS